MIGTIKNIKCWDCWYKVKIVYIDKDVIWGSFKLNRRKFRKACFAHGGAFPFDKIQEIRPSASK